MLRHYFFPPAARTGPVVRTALRLVLAAGCAAAFWAQAAPLQVRFAYVGSEQHSAYLGVRQGLEEANLQGRFLGQSYSVDTLDAAAAADGDLSPYAAVLAAVDPATLRALAGDSAERPIFNLSSDDDGLRADCFPALLHVVPSARMKQDAVAQWRTKHPDAQVSAAAWHPDFTKYAARDLNKRFRAAFDTDMDDKAWAGWAAVKMTSDTVARRGITDPAALLEYLKARLVFDGQKGAEMNFRETGQLRQPLVLVEDGELVGEAPVRSVAESEGALDSLGMTNCRHPS